MKNKDKEIIQITEIKIRLKDKEIVLTSDEAREVMTELNKIFLLEPKKSELQKLQEEWNEFQKRNPQPICVPQPIWIERWPQYPYKIGEPIWVVDPTSQPTYTSPTTQPLNPSYTTCLNIDLTK
jgi:hypothetical protein